MRSQPSRASDHLHGQVRQIHPRQDHVLGHRPMCPTFALEDLPFSFEGARLGRHKRAATEHADDVVVRRTAIPDAKDLFAGFGGRRKTLTGINATGTDSKNSRLPCVVADPQPRVQKARTGATGRIQQALAQLDVTCFGQSDGGSGYRSTRPSSPTSLRELSSASKR